MDVKEILSAMKHTEGVITRDVRNAIMDFESLTETDIIEVKINLDWKEKHITSTIKIRNPFDTTYEGTSILVDGKPVDPWGLKK